MKLVLSAQARADLTAISRYTQSRYGSRQAMTYRALLEMAFRRLLDFPESGPVLKFTEPETR